VSKHENWFVSLSAKPHDLQKECMGHQMCFTFCYTSSLTPQPPFLLNVLQDMLMMQEHVFRKSVLYSSAVLTTTKKQKKQTLWPESTSELYQPRDRRLSAKLVPTFADIGCHAGSVTGPYGHTLGFLAVLTIITVK
jgi:hypothetical protein